MLHVLRKNRHCFPFYIILGLLLLLIVAFISVQTGYRDISFLSFMQTILGNGTAENVLTIFHFRLPRICMAILVGFGIAVSGAILQSITKNALADPGIMGINAGAGFAIVLYTFFLQGWMVSKAWLAVFVMPLIALIGALLAALIIYVIAYKSGHVAPSHMLLVGIGMNAAFSAGIIFFQIRMDPNDFTRTLVWLAGSIWGSTWTYVYALLPWIVVLLPIAFYKARVLDILMLNDITAIGVGITVTKERKQLIIVAVLLAGVCVAVGGGITFLGLLAPHIAKKLVGGLHFRVIPLSAFVGALLLILADTISRIMIAPAELPVGIVLAIIGAPYFIYLLVKTRG
ncbi:FecCD family ABC transporter permease [Lysinibacillus sp. NPDC097195]|uniref:FecCD family ABC transporter permease n=1 Tax=Lysinibacillus sp. NPDC097195 TaxID=3364141 RepID=UPI0037F2B973